VLFGLSWQVAAVAAVVWVVTVAVTRFSSLGSLLGVVSVPITIWRLHQPEEYLYFGVIAALFAIYRHRANIQRLVSGTELRITDREPLKK
jgi:acyl phosphate:glycerol-3-phosphate acyltransferase